MANPTPLVVHTAERLRADLSGSGLAALPPLRTLASRYGVSWPTMARVLDLLANEGLIVKTPRCRARVVQTADVSAPLDPGLARDHLAARFRTEISAGSLSAGEPLPKIGYLARREHMSDHTVGHAYDILVGEGLVHRQGKQFIVGQQIRLHRDVRATSAPVILVLCVKRSMWESVCLGRRTEQFGAAFLRERDRLGARLIHVPASAGGAHKQVETAHLRRILGEVGPRYQGTIIADDRTGLPDLADWARLLDRYGRPVVWFDRNDQGLGTQDRPGRHFFRCHYSEDAAVAAAVDYLARMGHRRICYIYDGRAPWQSHRMERLAAAVALCQSPIELVTSVNVTPEDWESPLTGRIDEAFRSIAAIKLPRVRQALAFFASNRDQHCSVLEKWIPREARNHPFAGAFGMTLGLRHDPSVCSLAERDMLGVIWSSMGLRHALLSGATAVIAANDNLCRGHHLSWLVDLKLRAPDHVSVISFDNAFRLLLYHLTSIDMGFGTLGYLAFHALTGDIPVKADRAGNIAVRPFVVDNGSVGRVVAEKLKIGVGSGLRNYIHDNHLGAVRVPTSVQNQ